MTIEYLKRASKTPETETGTVTIVPLKDETGRMVGMAALMRDVSVEEMKALRRQPPLDRLGVPRAGEMPHPLFTGLQVVSPPYDERRALRRVTSLRCRRSAVHYASHRVLTGVLRVFGPGPRM